MRNGKTVTCKSFNSQPIDKGPTVKLDFHLGKKIDNGEVDGRILN